MKFFGLLSILMCVSVFSQELPKSSVYHLQSKWKDQNGKQVQLKDFAGEKIIIGMVYTKCPHACPMTISKIKQIEAEISKQGSKKYRIVLASFDHKRDVPEHLKSYMKTRGLDESRWTFLSAPSDATARELAVVLGINYKELEDGEFSHSNVISLLDSQGVRQAKIESLSASNEPIVSAFKK